MENKVSKSPYRKAYKLLETKEIEIPPHSKDNSSQKLKRLLEDIQGNILRSHGRTYSIYLFLQFDPNQLKATKKWIGDFASKYVVSAIKQQEQSKKYKQCREKGITPPQKLFANFSLSFKGYQVLGLDAETNFLKLYRQKLDDHERNFRSPHPFEEGMVENISGLRDKDSDWESEYLNKEIHALILLAHSNADTLWKKTEKIITKIEDNKIRIINKEIGLARKNDQNQVLEPFGFPDGISNPLFFKTDLNNEVENMDKWNPSAKLRLVLNVDPFGKDFKDEKTGNQYSFGSFLVYRKLEQDVEGFNNKVRELACELEKIEKNRQPQEKTEQLVRAYIMGRFREDGRPVAIYGNLDSPEGSGIELNNFNYNGDDDDKQKAYFRGKSKWKCPFHSHIRKVNPRAIKHKVYAFNYKDSPENQRQRRIVRRGVIYGLPKENQASLLSKSTIVNLFYHYKDLSEKLGVKLEEGNEGILFFCYQSDIREQFEKLQHYSNEEDFGPKNSKNLGADPISGRTKKKPIEGQTDKYKGWPTQTWPREWGSKKDPVEDFDFLGFVTPRGGEYFFTPSLSFLKSLKEE